MNQAKMALRAHTEVVSRVEIEAMLQILTLCFGGGIAVRVFSQFLLIYYRTQKTGFLVCGLISDA